MKTCDVSWNTNVGEACYCCDGLGCDCCGWCGSETARVEAGLCEREQPV